MTPAMRQLFETLGDGVLILNEHGKVRFINGAAQRHLPIAVGDEIPAGPLQRFAASAMAGKLEIPSATELTLGDDSPASGAEPARAHVVRSPVGTDLIIVLETFGDERFFRAAVSNLEQMLTRACTAPIEDFDQAMESMLASLMVRDLDPAELRSRCEELARSGRAIVGTLNRLAALSSLSNGEPILASDRIPVDEWLTQALAAFSVEARSRGVAMRLDANKVEIAPIYGSRAWLDRALHECLDNALKYNGRGGEVLLSARASGAFVRTTIRSSGAGRLSAAQAARIVEPLYRGPNSTGTNGIGIGLPLARQIIELHGGHLAVDQDIDGFFSCSIELPAGRDNSPTPGAEAEQLKRYAHDLAQLMRRGRKQVSTN